MKFQISNYPKSLCYYGHRQVSQATPVGYISPPAYFNLKPFQPQPISTLGVGTVVSVYGETHQLILESNCVTFEEQINNTDTRKKRLHMYTLYAYSIMVYM